jgi:hypothetical protein
MRHSLQYTGNFVNCALLIASALLAGCTGVSSKGTWQDGAVRSQRFSRLLVVGVSPDLNIRCAFESTFASQLTSASTTVVSSCDKMDAKEPLTRENIARVVAEVHADAVLATRLVSSSIGEREGGSHDTRGTSLYKAQDYGYGMYGMPVTYVEFQTAQPLTAITSSLHVVTQVYQTSDAALAYTIDTTTKAKEVTSTEATLMTVAIATAARLRSAGLIR